MWNFFLISGFLLLLFALAIDKDFFSPSAILCEAYVLSTICAIYMRGTWNFTIHEDTVFVILVGNIWFIFVGLITKLMLKKRNRTVVASNMGLISYSKNNLLILDAVCLIIVALYIFSFFKILGGLNFTSFFRMMTYYKNNMDELEGIPTVVNQSFKLVRASAYIGLFIYLNNFMVSKINRWDLKLLFPAVCFAPTTLLTGGRFDLIIFLIYVVVLWIFFRRYYYERKIFSMKFVIKVLATFLIILLIFSNTRILVGRTNTLDSLPYISSYFGGSLQCFDVYLLRNGTSAQSSYFGQELFSGIYKFFVQFRIIDEIGGTGDLGAFVTANSVVVGNVYTAYRKIVHDFGVGGYSSSRGCIAF